MQVDQTKLAFLISYAPVELVQSNLQKHIEDIESYAYILHDRDIYTEDIYSSDGDLQHSAGELKVPHVHIFIACFSAHKIGVYRKWFQVDDGVHKYNCLTQKVKSPQGALHYLTHEGREDKTLYDDSEVVKFNCDDWYNKPILDSQYNVALDILNDMLLDVSPYDMVKKYGQNYVVNYQNYERMYKIVVGNQYYTKESVDFGEK